MYNAQAATLCVVPGAFLGLPVAAVLLMNMVDIDVGIGLRWRRRAAWTPFSAYSYRKACSN
ncbi:MULTISPECIES: hypothetical protein [Streptomyces]|uniref:Uncharacterized protein n=1 Tax=Streptomyces rutgersensis TaxID=53451 RepID=A0ABX6RS81_9ACTN|nr:MULTISPECIES: hypothetical protein [Streptomyces]NEE35474.1 hypothetical protein [Streptomyces sp. SID7982]NEE54718.1 hypothetical protein [Streptomyces sp. SID8455]MBL3804767.1 hypothetical protein [Streptomyces sp. BRB081]PJM81663.1 hypothetical protein CH313_20065 [Streptomyces sp. TSRI0384-2]QNE82893.1 hypothetical protein F0345_18705 [Streptomyces rutgersensis]